MVRLAISLFLCVLFTSSAEGQQLTFNKTIDMMGDHEINLGVVELEGGYMVVHNNLGNTWETQQLIAAKLDEDGELVWQARFCQDSSICALPNSSLFHSGTGTLLAIGQHRSPENSRGDAMLFEFSLEGDSLGIYRFGSDSLENFYSIKVLADGGLIAAGGTDFSDPFSSDCYMVRLNSEYELLWERYFGGDGYQYAQSVDQTPDGGFIIAGVKFVSFTEAEILLYKTDSLGQIEWERTLADEGDNVGQHNVKVLSDSTLLVTATRGMSSGNHISYLAKVDLSGDLIWENVHFASTRDFFSTPAIELVSGNLVVAGTRHVYNSSTNDYVIHGKITQFTADGEAIWDHVYHGRPDIDNYFYGLIRTSDGGYLAHGSSYGPDNATLQDGWIVKMDSEGVACESLGCVLVNEEEVRTGNPQLVLSPNPASDYAYIDYRLPQVTSDLHFSVFDSQGRQLWQYKEPFPSDTGSIGFSVADWPAGLYLVRLTSAEGEVATRRLVVGRI